MAHVSLLQEALSRATLDRSPRSRPPSERGRPRVDHLAAMTGGAVTTEPSDSDDDLVAVATPATDMSRSTSPTRMGPRRRRLEREMEARSSHDPLKRLPGPVAQRVFGALDYRSLAVCSRVCRRWNRSATISEFVS